MIARQFWSARTHTLHRDAELTTESYAGCVFQAPAALVVRTACGAFLDRGAEPVAVLVLAERPTCPACKTALAMAAARSDAWAT